jgi:hypothetical protein
MMTVKKTFILLFLAVAAAAAQGQSIDQAIRLDPDYAGALPSIIRETMPKPLRIGRAH